MSPDNNPSSRIVQKEGLLSYDGVVPLVESLADELPHGISEKTHTNLVTLSRQYEDPYRRTQATRRVDLSGLVPNLADSCQNKEEVESALFPLAEEQIKLIKLQERLFKQELFNTLEGRSTTPRAITWLDASIAHIISSLTRQRGLISIQMQQDADNSLPKDGGITYFPMYILGRHGNELDYVNYSYKYPPLTEASREILEKLTPDLLRRGSYPYDQPYPVDTPVGFLRQIGIIGIPYIRALVQHIADLKQAGEISIGNEEMYLFVRDNP